MAPVIAPAVLHLSVVLSVSSLSISAHSAGLWQYFTS